METKAIMRTAEIEGQSQQQSMPSGVGGWGRDGAGGGLFPRVQAADGYTGEASAFRLSGQLPTDVGDPKRVCSTVDLEFPAFITSANRKQSARGKAGRTGW
jgi:hypothetical protein